MTTERTVEPTAELDITGVLASGERPAPPGTGTAALTFGWRSMLKIKHVPEQLLDVTVTPVLFVLMFTYMFGGAIAGSTQEYLQFLLPGVLVMAVLFTTIYSGVALNADLTKGVVDRLRSLPIPRSAPLLGAALGDSLRYLLGGLVVLVVGLAIGYRAGGGVAGVVAALALVVVFACGLAWMFTMLGTLLRSPQAVMNAGFMSIFPLTFLSNAFVDPSTLPGPLETVVEINPVSHLTTAVRGLMDGTSQTADVVWVLVAAGVLTAVFAPVTMYLYRRRV